MKVTCCYTLNVPRQNKKHKVSGLKKFLAVLAILLVYAMFAVYKFGIEQGFLITALSWSFFVFCTPIADAGFLVDFPVRLITGFRMLYSEIIVWVVATVLNITVFTTRPSIYGKTQLLQLFHKIIVNPWPFWLIIFLSAIGTFANVLLDDDVYDVATVKNKKQFLGRGKVKIIYTIGTFVVTFILYFFVLHYSHTKVKVF